jgi:hypothetical protein
MKLYHGTIQPIEHLDLSQCRDKTDFGRGFYTTTSLEQARKWAALRQQRLRVKEAFVMEYEIEDSILTTDDYKTLHFHGATEEWLEFVFRNRRGIATHDYDMIMGPVANDSLYATLLLYEQGILSVEATIEQLKTHTLFDQLSFHTPRALQTLHFVQTMRISK